MCPWELEGVEDREKGRAGPFSCPIQVHRMIAEFKLIPGLNNLFDKLIWRKHSASALVLHGHNQNCDCSPVSKGPQGQMGFTCQQ